MGWAVVFVASTIADCPYHPPKGITFLYNAIIIYKPWTFFRFFVFNVMVCISFDFAIKVAALSPLDTATSGV